MGHVTRTSTLRDVVVSILDTGLRTTAVVGDDGRLIGIVTEGDVLRAVARGSGPGVTAESLMNVSPGFLLDPPDDRALAEQFLELGRIAVPILDSDGRYLRLESTGEAIMRLLGDL